MPLITNARRLASSSLTTRSSPSVAVVTSFERAWTFVDPRRSDIATRNTANTPVTSNVISALATTTWLRSGIDAVRRPTRSRARRPRPTGSTARTALASAVRCKELLDH